MENGFEQLAVDRLGLQELFEVVYGRVAPDGVLENKRVDALRDRSADAFDVLGVGRARQSGDFLRQRVELHDAFGSGAFHGIGQRLEVELRRGHAEVPVHGDLVRRRSRVAAQPQPAPDGLLVRRDVEQGVDEVHALQRARIEPLVKRPRGDDDLGVPAVVVFPAPEGSGIRLEDVFVQSLLRPAGRRHRPHPVHDEPRGLGREPRALDVLFALTHVILAGDGRVPHLGEERDHDLVRRAVADVQVLLARHAHRVGQRRAELIAQQSDLAAADVHGPQHAARPLGGLELVELRFRVQPGQRGLGETVARGFLLRQEAQLFGGALRLGVIQVFGRQFPDRAQEPEVILVVHRHVDVLDGLDAVSRRVAANVGVADEAAEFRGVGLDVGRGQHGHAQGAHEVQDVEHVVDVVAGGRGQREHEHPLAVLFLDELLGQELGGAREFGVRGEQALHLVHDQHAPHLAPLGFRGGGGFPAFAAVFAHQERGAHGVGLPERAFLWQAQRARQRGERERPHAVRHGLDVVGVLAPRVELRGFFGGPRRPEARGRVRKHLADVIGKHLEQVDRILAQIVVPRVIGGRGEHDVSRTVPEREHDTEGGYRVVRHREIPNRVPPISVENRAGVLANVQLDDFEPGPSGVLLLLSRQRFLAVQNRRDAFQTFAADAYFMVRARYAAPVGFDTRFDDFFDVRRETEAPRDERDVFRERLVLLGDFETVPTEVPVRIEQPGQQRQAIFLTGRLELQGHVFILHEVVASQEIRERVARLAAVVGAQTVIRSGVRCRVFLDDHPEVRAGRPAHDLGDQFFIAQREHRTVGMPVAQPRAQHVRIELWVGAGREIHGPGPEQFQVFFDGIRQRQVLLQRDVHDMLRIQRRRKRFRVLARFEIRTPERADLVVGFVVLHRVRIVTRPMNQAVRRVLQTQDVAGVAFPRLALGRPDLVHGLPPAPDVQHGAWRAVHPEKLHPRFEISGADQRPIVRDHFRVNLYALAATR